jgi:hypothetical protein
VQGLERFYDAELYIIMKYIKEFELIAFAKGNESDTKGLFVCME